MSQWHAHNRVVMFHTLHRGQRDTLICPYLVNCATLYPVLFPQLRESYMLIFLLYSYSLSSSYSSAYAATSAVSLEPVRPNPTCYHHLIPTRAPPLPLCRLSQVQKRLRHNILRNRILYSPNVGLQWIKLRLLPCPLRWGVLPIVTPHTLFLHV